MNKNLQLAPKIVILLASQGKNRELAHTIQRLSDTYFQHCDIIDTVALDLPLYSHVREQQAPPDSITHGVHAALRSSSALAVASPEYNGGIPPSLTNTLAWVSRINGEHWRQAFANKPTILASYSGGAGTRVLMALRSQLSYLGCHVLGREVAATTDRSVEDSLHAVLSECSRLALAPTP